MSVLFGDEASVLFHCGGFFPERYTSLGLFQRVGEGGFSTNQSLLTVLPPGRGRAF
jgi:hypothetical protein